MDGLIAITENLKADLIEVLGIAAKRVMVAPLVAPHGPVLFPNQDLRALGVGATDGGLWPTGVE